MMAVSAEDANTSTTQRNDGASSSPQDPAAIAHLTSLLDTTWRISLKGPPVRTFVGRFVVVDRQRNVVLDEAFELFRNGEERNVGLIMIPGQDIASAEVDRETMVA